MDNNAAMLELYADSYSSMAKMGDGKVSASDVAYDIRHNMVKQLVPVETSAQEPAREIVALQKENERLREAIKPTYLGLLVLKTMCRKAGLNGGVEATVSALVGLVAAMPELPAIAALRAEQEEEK